MRITFFQVTQAAFPKEKAERFLQFHDEVASYLRPMKYGAELDAMHVGYKICPKEERSLFPRPQILVPRPSPLPAWPDLALPLRLDVKSYVSSEVAAVALGGALKHSLIDPVCEALGRSPASYLARLDLAALIGDLFEWAESEG